MSPKSIITYERPEFLAKYGFASSWKQTIRHKETFLPSADILAHVTGTSHLVEWQREMDNQNICLVADELQSFIVPYMRLCLNAMDAGVYR